MKSISNTMKLITKFRESCLIKYGEDIGIYPIEKQNTRMGTVIAEVHGHKVIQEILSSTKNTQPIYIIAKLLKTPRNLKAVLRRTLKAWDVLHGEIDFDDLLMLNTIRRVAPQANMFMIENVELLRSLDSEGIYGDKAKREEELKLKWEAIEKLLEYDAESVKKLIEKIFPAWGRDRRDAVPQGVNVYSPTDYWLRANYELIQGEISDQEILHAMKEWKNVGSAQLKKMSIANALYSIEGCSDKMEQFASNVLDGYDFRKIASSLFDVILKENKSCASEKKAEAFTSLWRLTIHSPVDQKQHDKWVLDEIDKALSISLNFANDIYYLYKFNNETEVQTKNTGSSRILVEYIKLIKKHYYNKPKKLISVLCPEHIYALSHIMLFYHSSNEGGVGGGFEPEGWHWLMNTIVGAVEIAPGIILPHVSMLFIKSSVSGSKYLYSFEEKNAIDMFGDKLENIMKLLASEILFKDLNENDVDKMREVRVIATKWLEKH